MERMEWSLPLSGNDGERRDASRNRRLLLHAASTIVACSGVDSLTMDGVAREAGVGKGTVFRRFGSRAGLMQALADQTGRTFQEAFMFGPPPLGPGAPARERLRAFGAASIDRLEVDGRVVRAAGSPGGPDLAHPTQRLVRLHLIMLLREAGVQGDSELAAYQLAAFLDAGLLLHLSDDRGMPRARLVRAWNVLVDGLTD
ncbi:TetR/AcrR family transcriptional regulator [Arthrobacter sp. Br18]|uniref:TetR/AcrR family transcriptional regulator n=1 Tax=Arthrobacter sp. Br18 TaxID=1312954 RepID=UPI0004ADA57B|nr:TetR/AcrR family transcriptional regulator [Arthrobacter sp. Br18]